MVFGWLSGSETSVLSAIVLKFCNVTYVDYPFLTTQEIKGDLEKYVKKKYKDVNGIKKVIIETV